MTTTILSNPKYNSRVMLCSLLLLQIGLGLSALWLPQNKSGDTSHVATWLLIVHIIAFPVSYYFLYVRKYKTRVSSMLLFFSISCAIAYISLPSERHYIIQLRKLTVLLELGIIAYLVTKIRAVRAEYKHLQALFVDEAYNIRNSILAVLGNRVLFKLLGTEIVILRYGFGLWRSEKQPYNKYRSYTSHKESGYIAVWAVFVFVIIVETFVVHILMERWSTKAAIIVSGLSIYGLFLFFADMNAIIRRPILLAEQQLFLRVGFRWKCIIDINNISSVTAINTDHSSDTDIHMGTAIKSGANVMVNLTDDVKIERFMKPPLLTRSIVLSVDSRSDFIQDVNYEINAVNDKYSIAT